MWRRRAVSSAMSAFPKNSPMRMSCGELRPYHVGALVELAGSIQQRRLNRFLYIRDAHGTTQLVVPDNRPDIGRRLLKLPLRSFVSVIGWVRPRPAAAVNESMTTGRVEVAIEDLAMVRVNRGQAQANGDVPVRRMSTASDAAAVRKALTSEEYHKCGSSEYLLWRFKHRPNTCSGLTADDAERNVVLIGWVQGKHLPRFIKLKDGYGIIQCMLSSKIAELQEVIQKATPDDILQVEGKIAARPQSNINAYEENGDIEILVNSLLILDPKHTLPLSVMEVENTDAKVGNLVADFGSKSNYPEEQDGVNCYTWRTHTCGELSLNNVGEQVVLCGWLQFWRMGRFIILRDSYGVIQCLISEENAEKWNIDRIPLESILEIHGLVGKRPSASVNAELATGEVEVLVTSLKVLNAATFLPIPMSAFNKPKEELCLQHRFLYLRYPEMQRNLRTRSTMVMKMRKFLIDNKEFVEVETPTLFCRTPGGAKEFVVPTRHKGKFYSLIQSPQQHKQMLMAGGIDRYFQVARCYRDETTRGDRQPEFTQLDIEMSFASRDDVLSLVEDLFRAFWPQTISSEPFLKLTYDEALTTYGTDKPDISYGFKLQNVTDVLKMKEELIPNDADSAAFAIVVRKSELDVTNNFKKKMRPLLGKHSNVKSMMLTVDAPVEEWSNSVAVLGKEVMTKLAWDLRLNMGDSLILSYGDKENCCWTLGDVRKKIASEAESHDQLKRTPAYDAPLWIVDFPLFTKEADGSLASCHHPFTAPRPEDVEKLATEPLKVRSLAYDLVLRGNEVGGGSVRMHDADMQLRVLDMLKISAEPLKHFVNALKSGCPPHAGIALGIDRLVALACDAETIRDVIAFPKSHEGCDPLTGAPSALSQEERELYHIAAIQESGDPKPKRLHTE